MSDTLFDMEQVQKAARLSDCGTYRYWLGRRWDARAPLVFVMLNPSTADAEVDDQTIKRCMYYARRDGFGGVEVVNLYALRSPYPATLWTHPDPVGPENDAHLLATLTAQAVLGNPVIAAWGTNARPERVDQVLAMTNAEWVCLGTTKDGHPRHPGRLANDQPLVRWTP